MLRASPGRYRHISGPFFFENIQRDLGHLGGRGAVNPAQIRIRHPADQIGDTFSP